MEISWETKRKRDTRNTKHPGGHGRENKLIFCVNESISPKSLPRKPLMKRPDPQTLLLCSTFSITQHRDFAMLAAPVNGTPATQDAEAGTVIFMCAHQEHTKQSDYNNQSGRVLRPFPSLLELLRIPYVISTGFQHFLRDAHVAPKPKETGRQDRGKQTRQKKEKK